MKFAAYLTSSVRSKADHT